MSPSPATSGVRSRPTAAAASLSIRRLPSASNQSQQGDYSNYVIQDARHFTPPPPWAVLARRDVKYPDSPAKEGFEAGVKAGPLRNGSPNVCDCSKADIDQLP